MRSLLLIPCLLLAACGGASGGAGPATEGTRPPAGQPVPGGEISVRQTSGASFRLDTTLSGVAGVEVLTGADYASAMTVALVRDGEGWTGSAAPGASLMVRLTLADGSVVETAPGGFVLR